ncbi:MAG: hypothetical protein K8T20_11515, partial [Planctomycetes bacterium]|nr:hypothetical protein [Planctomycetota bacterium]
MKPRLVLFFAVAAAIGLGLRAEDPPKPAPPAKEEGPLLDEAVMRQLAKALDSVNLSVDDLGWNKRPIDDDFRLKCVNDTLDRPMNLAAWAAKAEKEFNDDPLAAARAGTAWLDVDPSKIVVQREEKFGIELPVEPAAAKQLFFAALRNWRRAERERRAAMEALDDADEAMLRKDGVRLYADESEEDWNMTTTLATAKKIDIAGLFKAEIALAEAANELRSACAKIDGKDWKTGTWTLPASTAYPELKGLTLALGGPGPDRHTADIVIDAGGDDVYEGCKLVVDLGGNDTFTNCGGGLLSCGLILDLAGNDRYLGGNITQGGAAFGCSLLIDVAGDDRYEADTASQGSGFFGVGMLFDLAGNDGYRGAKHVQGFGGVRGLGVLSDVAGNDTYYAGGKYSHAPLLPENFQSLSQGFGFGLRGANTSGGVGILADHAGNDQYTAEVFGQGASYWFSLGVLVDSAGHDKYDLYQYGQGAGIHLSSGVLFDRAGNDSYSCNNGVAQGCGHDWAAGMLLDLAGN